MDVALSNELVMVITLAGILYQQRCAVGPRRVRGVDRRGGSGCSVDPAKDNGNAATVEDADQVSLLSLDGGQAEEIFPLSQNQASFPHHGLDTAEKVDCDGRAFSEEDDFPGVEVPTITFALICIVEGRLISIRRSTAVRAPVGD